MTGVPVLLLHGLSQQRRFWDPVIRRMRSEPVVAVDLRGHGDTDTPLDADYSIAACADDVVVALDTLGWPEAVVAGHSWGAAVALSLAARHPDRVRSIALIDGGLWPPVPPESRAERREALTPPVLGIDEATLWTLVRSGDLAGTWNDEAAAALRPTYVAGPDGLMRTRLGFDRHMKVLDGLLDHDLAGDLRTLEALGTPVWAAVCEPTDRPLNPACADLTGLRVHRWAGAVHDVPLQWPALVAGFVDALVESGGGQQPVIELDEFPVLVDPVMVAAFEGWNDAGDSASNTVAHLREVWDAQPLADLDSEEYYDYQVNRPHISVDETGVRSLTWPATRVYVARVPLFPRDIVLVQGIEPNMKWQQFVREILGLAAELEVSTVVTLGALLSDIPHTRPVPVTGTTSDAALGAELGLEPSTYEGPTGIVGVLQDACARFGISSVSLWAAVPHYVAQPPCPKATLALVRRIEDILDIPVPLGDLVEEARAWEIGVDELASEDDEVAEYVRQLEEARDAADLPEASGEAIAREFERYLRRRGTDS